MITRRITLTDYGLFDFVVIGGGVSGSVITHRLSEVTTWKILLIEAGDFTDGGFVQIPSFVSHHVRSRYNWGYSNVPKKNACLGLINETCSTICGKGVGGTSLIDRSIYCRGPPKNYNDLATLVNDSTWNYQNILKYHKKTESLRWTNPNAPLDTSFHNTVGLLTVQQRDTNTFLNKPFIRANWELGYYLTDYNGLNMLGTSYTQWYTRYGRREDFGSVFITPVLGRPNMKVTTQSFVTKIEVNNEKVAGSVLFTKGGTTYRVWASKEIVVSAGAIATPHLLMLSGIGPQKHLNDMNIKVVQNLEVGSTYRDHIFTNALPFSSNLRFNKQSLESQLSDYMNGKGDLTTSIGPQSIGFYQTTATDNGVPDFEVIPFVSGDSLLERKIYGWKDETYDAIWANKNGTSLGFMLFYFSTKSSGTLRLKSNNPYDYPSIDSNLFSDENDEDLDGMYRGLEFIFKLTNTSTYRSKNLTYSSGILPACKNYEFRTKDYWYCFLRQVAVPTSHQVGTCKMGTDPEKGAVVDSKLKVFGIQNLRVVDASVFPFPIAGHTTIPCTTIAEKISDVIKKQYGQQIF